MTCSSTQPLRGVRVLDVTNVLSGPFACHQLAHLGADVIKVESRDGGDLARQLGADEALSRAGMGVSFLAQNAGKRSLTLDLKHPEGKAVFRRLVKTADVLVENFRPGVMDRLGLGFKTLVPEQPRLVYCAITGFGQDGPLAQQPAYDQIVQGMAGVMSITGDAATAPYRVGYPLADSIGGLTAALAVVAALADRHRSTAVFIDVSMLEATLATMGWAVSNQLIAGRAPSPLGNDNVTASPSGTFRARDGLINIAANQQAQFEALCRAVGRPEWIDDPRFADRHSRLDHRRPLALLLDAALSFDTVDHWWDRLTAAGVPAGPVLSVPGALELPQIAQRGLIATFAQVPGVGRDIRVARPGIKLDGQPLSVATPPPTLGAHTDDILAELGLDAAARERLHSQGVT